jgi:hypothetical protein
MPMSNVYLNESNTNMGQNEVWYPDHSARVADNREVRTQTPDWDIRMLHSPAMARQPRLGLELATRLVCNKHE